jgi:membrane protease YdiL (CAAX protease family)
MTDIAEVLPILPPQPVPPWPSRRLGTWIAWSVILLGVAFIVYRTVIPHEEETAQEEKLENVVWRMQARYLIGWKNTFGSQMDVYEQAKTFNRGGPRQRLQFVVLAGELAGPGEALRLLAAYDRIPRDEQFRPTAEQERIREILGRLYRDHAMLHLHAPSVTAGDRALLRERLGWFGQLALAPPGNALRPEAAAAVAGAWIIPRLGSGKAPDSSAREAVLDPAKKTFMALIGGVLVMLLIGLAGVVGLIVLLILYFLGRLHGGLLCGATWGGVYAETFAVWLILSLGLGWGARQVDIDVPPLLLHSIVALFGLVALGWPVVRGLSWRQVREDIGLTLGRKPALEPLLGLGCYAMSLPLVFIGLVLTLVLQHILRGQMGVSPDSPVHPIVEPLSRDDWWSRAQVLFLACVVAPVVEEIMFRGVLYRHLREATCRLGMVWSVLLSAVVLSFIFAVIHPQGLIAVPVLMALAFAFALAREWRVSLIPAMVAHGVSNGVVATMNILAQGG